MGLLVIGHGQHGKGTFCKAINEYYGITSLSSSRCALEEFLKHRLAIRHGLYYTSLEEAYIDRVNHRKIWFDEIANYNFYDATRLASKVYENSDTYDGMRSRREILACKERGIISLTIWIDASERLPLEDKSSLEIDRSLADIIIENNGTPEDFDKKIRAIGPFLIMWLIDPDYPNYDTEPIKSHKV